MEWKIIRLSRSCHSHPTFTLFVSRSLSLTQAIHTHTHTHTQAHSPFAYTPCVCMYSIIAWYSLKFTNFVVNSEAVFSGGSCVSFPHALTHLYHISIYYNVSECLSPERTIRIGYSEIRINWNINVWMGEKVLLRDIVRHLRIYSTFSFTKK